MLLGTAADLPLAQAPQVLLADAGDPCHFPEGPRACQIRGDFLPQAPEAGIRLVRPRETQDVVLDQVRPVMQGRGRTLTGAFPMQAPDRT